MFGIKLKIKFLEKRFPIKITNSKEYNFHILKFLKMIDSKFEENTSFDFGTVINWALEEYNKGWLQENLIHYLKLMVSSADNKK